jgi:hypothetical protein
MTTDDQDIKRTMKVLQRKMGFSRVDYEVAEAKYINEDNNLPAGISVPASASAASGGTRRKRH